jgi:hypothetical protein
VGDLDLCGFNEPLNLIIHMLNAFIDVVINWDIQIA